MGAGDGDELVRIGDRPDAHLHPRPALALVGVVAVKRTRIAAVGITGPDVMGDVGVAIDVVPPRVDDHPVVRHARLPLVRLVVAQQIMSLPSGFIECIV